MLKKRLQTGLIACALFLFGTTSWLVMQKPSMMLHQANLRLQDELILLGSKAEPQRPLVFVGIDEASIDLGHLEEELVAGSTAYQLMSERFPWSREVYALTIKKLREAGAAVILLDILLQQPAEGDEALVGELQTTGAPVVMASNFGEPVNAGLAALYTPPSPTLQIDEDLTGFANFWPDYDGVVRSASYTLSGSQAAGLERFAGDVIRVSLSGQAARALSPSLELPEAAQIPFRPVPPHLIRRVALWELFDPEVWKRNLRGGEAFRDAVVIIGPLAKQFQDFVSSPYGLIPGPEMHLHAFAALEDSAFLRPSPLWLTLGILALTLAGAAVVVLRIQKPFIAAPLLLLLGVVVAAAIFGFYEYYSVLVPPLYPLGSLILYGAIGILLNFTAETLERTRIRHTFERYVSKDVVREILDNQESYLGALGGARKSACILFSDIRGFTAMTENRDPVDLVTQLNEYLGRMVEEVLQEKGTLDKFIGDAVMATWGTVSTQGQETDALASVRSAVGMLKALTELNRSWRGRGIPELHIGIGIHRGEIVYGNMGSEKKMEPTAIGDAVNTASRIEGLTKIYRCPLLLSDAVARLVRKSLPLQTVDTVRVAGRSSDLSLYTVCLDSEGRPWNPGWLDIYESGWGKFRKRLFLEAAACFEQVLEQEPGNAPAAQMADRCRTFLKNPPGQDWKPVTIFDHK